MDNKTAPTARQKAALVAIAKRKGERVTEKVIAADLGISHPAAWQLLNRLERKGLLRRSTLELT